MVLYMLKSVYVHDPVYTCPVADFTHCFVRCFLLCCVAVAATFLLVFFAVQQTSATFLRIVGSELIQKYLGDGPKLVREMFRLADDQAPSIVFIDEIDAVGTKRYDSTSGGEREIQRTMLELLNQLDGFDSRGDVKVLLATNRIETLVCVCVRDHDEGFRLSASFVAMYVVMLLHVKDALLSFICTQLGVN